MNFPFKNPVLRFLTISFSLYIAWHLLYEMWLHPGGYADLWLIDNIAAVTSWILESFGYEMLTFNRADTIRVIGLKGTNGLWIGDPCNGLTLFGLFTGFIIAYPGHVKKKILFIPCGIITIHLVNILRVAALCLVDLYAPAMLAFNHTYTFTVIVYSYVFMLWILWAKKLSK